MIRTEGDRLATLSHQNITSIYLTGDIDVIVGADAYRFPYFLMDYLEGVRDFDIFILDNLSTLTAENLIDLFRNVTLGLAVLHDSGIVHCDVKPGNLIVAPGRPALVADLGYAKHIEVDDTTSNRFTAVTFTLPYGHPELVEKLVRSSETAATVAEIPREQLRPAYDLYSLGRTFQEILSRIREVESAGPQTRSVFTDYQWHYLTIVASRLLDGVVTRRDNDALLSDVVPGLTKQAMLEVRYGTAKDALEDLEKLANLYDLEGEVPELNPNISTYIQVLGCCVPVTSRVKATINYPMYMRLQQTTQLGFVSQIYPGAQHSRFEHSLGVFERTCEIIRGLWYDETNCLFRSLMSKSDLEAALVAALLHDIGQYPMAHELSEVDDNLRHETLTETMILSVVAGSSLADLISGQWGLEVRDVLGILEANDTSPIRKRILKSIISGPVDADKLDYLIRDSMHCGVSFGFAIDAGRLLRNLTVCLRSRWQPDEQMEIAEIGVAEKALAVASSVWRARREMFRQVYWQHTTRCLKAMLAYVVRRILIRIATDGREAEFAQALLGFAMFPMGTCICQVDIEKNNTQDLDFLMRPEDDVATLGDSVRPGWASGLAPSDDWLLLFLWSYARPGERAVIQMIRRRILYRRIAVISHEQSASLFDEIYEWYRVKLREHGHEGIEEWRGSVETEILQELGIEAEVESDHSAGAPKILVDVPVKSVRREARSGLHFIPESQLRNSRTRSVRFPIPSEAKVRITEPVFDREVGKIRVFLLPSVSNLGGREISSSRMEAILEESVR